MVANPSCLVIRKTKITLQTGVEKIKRPPRRRVAAAVTQE